MPTIQKWGNSLAIRIPASLAGQMAVSDGSEVELSVQGGELIVRPMRPAPLSLKELLRNCRPSQLPAETDFGPDVGAEVIP